MGWLSTILHQQITTITTTLYVPTTITTTIYTTPTICITITNSNNDHHHDIYRDHYHDHHQHHHYCHNHVHHQVGRVLEEQEGVQGAVGRQHAELEGGEVEGDGQQPTTSPRELWIAPHQSPNLFFPKSWGGAGAEASSPQESL